MISASIRYLINTRTYLSWKERKRRYCSNTPKIQCRCTRWSSLHDPKIAQKEKQGSSLLLTYMRRGCISPKNSQTSSTSIQPLIKSLWRQCRRKKEKYSWKILDKSRLHASIWTLKTSNYIHKKAFWEKNLILKTLSKTENWIVFHKMDWIMCSQEE